MLERRRLAVVRNILDVSWFDRFEGAVASFLKICPNKKMTN